MNAATRGLPPSYSNLQNTFQMKDTLITGLPVDFLKDDKSIYVIADFVNLIWCFPIPLS